MLDLEGDMPISPAATRYGIRIEVGSLVAGPFIMTVGDLIHPQERMDASEQIAILVNDASRWYTSHLLLFIGIIVAIPGMLALAGLTERRRPGVGYAARVLVLIGTAALAAIFVAEMLIGRFIVDGADATIATNLWNSMFSGPMVAAVMPSTLAFFVGIVLFAVPLIQVGGALRYMAALYLIGSLSILAEILSAQVILSQIGNSLILCGGSLAAWRILRGNALPPTIT